MSKNEGSLTSVSYFITTTYDMVDDLSLDSIISWSQSGKSFIIWNPEEFYNNLLQRFCFQRINTFFSFLFSHVSYLYMITLVRCHHRQFCILSTLNLPFRQGFRKIDSGKWEFANDNFVRGQRHLINNIISDVIEQEVQYDQGMELFKAEKLFARLVKKVQDQLPPHNSYPTSKLPFPTKIYEMVDDPSSDAIISWSQSGKSFIIWNPQEFCKDHLRRLFNTLHIHFFFYKLKIFVSFLYVSFVRCNHILLASFCFAY